MPDLFQSVADLVNQYVLPYLSWTLVFPLGTLILVLLFFFYYWHAQAPRRDSLEWIAMRERRPMTFSAKRYPMGKKDALPLLLVTAAFDVWGFCLGVVGIFILLCTTKPLVGKGYLYPLVPFNGKALLRLLVREPISRDNT